MPYRKMPDKLLEIVDGELTVRYEYGEHRALVMPDATWFTIYKCAACVSLSLVGVNDLTQKDVAAKLGLETTELGSRKRLDMDDGRLLCEPIVDADGVFRGSLTLCNVGALTCTTTPERHHFVLSLPELRSLARMLSVLWSFDGAFSLGLAEIGSHGRRHRSCTLTPEQAYGFYGHLHTCELTLGGELVLEPYAAAFEADCCEHMTVAEAEAWRAKARLRLSQHDAGRLLDFDLDEIADVGDSDCSDSLSGAVSLPRAGRVLRLNDERSVGVFRSERYFPAADDNAACALVPFTPSEWHWLCACLGLYVVMADYLGL